MPSGRRRRARWFAFAATAGLALAVAAPAAADAAGPGTSAPISVGLNPFGVAVNPSANAIYVADDGENTVSVVSTQTNLHPVIATIGVGVEPAVEVERAILDKMTVDLRCLARIRDGSRLISFHAGRLPRHRNNPALEAGRLEKGHRLRRGGRKAQLPQSLAPRFIDGSGQHGSGNALATAAGVHT